MSQPTNVVYTHKKFKRASSSQPCGGEPPIPEVATPSTQNGGSFIRTTERGSAEDGSLTGACDGESYASKMSQEFGERNLLVTASVVQEVQRSSDSETTPSGEGLGKVSGFRDLVVDRYTSDPEVRFKREIVDKELKIYKCCYCEYICDREDALQKHLISHLQPQNFPCICSRCGLKETHCTCQILSRLQGSHADGDSKGTHQDVLQNSTSHTYDEGNSQPADLTIRSAIECNDPENPCPQTYDNFSNSFDISSRTIYKPKFRATYSSDEVTDNFSVSGSSIIENTVNSDCFKRTNNMMYQSSSSASCSSGIQNKKSSLVNSNAMPATSLPANKLSGLAGLGLWKDIKSPSPDLGEHIDKIIVQNQVIMDADSHLWQRKYRRQSSIGSSSSESDGSSGSRHRRYSVNDKVKTTISSQLGLLNNVNRIRGVVPHDLSTGLINVSSGPAVLSTESSLSHSLGSHRRSISSTGQECSIFSTERRTTSSITASPIVSDSYSQHLSVEEAVAVNEQDILNLSKSDSETNKILLAKGHTLALQGTSILPVANAAALLLVCPSCSASFRSRESLQIHIERHCDIGLASVAKIQPIGMRANVDQEVALDLQKKQIVPNVISHENSRAAPGYFRGSSIGADVRLNPEPNRTDKSLSPFSRQHSLEPLMPPHKKRRLSSDLPSDAVKSNYPVFLHNGIVFQKSNMSIKSIEENRIPNNINQLCGGEVQIHDGNQCKTMKIDTSEANRSLALDMCINDTADKRMPNVESLVPSSVVVTLSKSGLNSGGTVVESRTGTYSKLATSLVTVSNDATLQTELHNLPFDIKSGVQNYCDSANSVNSLPLSSLQKYAPQLQLPNLSIPGVPIPNMTGIFITKKSSNQLNMAPKKILARDENKSFSNFYKDNSFSILKPNSIAKTEVSPSILSIGEDKVPYVPGIPGPYSQTSTSVIQTDTATGTTTCDANQYISSLSSSAVSTASPNVCLYSDAINTLQTTKATFSSCKNSPIQSSTVQNASAFKSSLSISDQLKNDLNLPDSSVTDNVLKHRSDEEESLCDETKPKHFHEKAETTKESFLVPRKRPDTLPLKPQQFVPKSTALLIGSTIMSPDTPRPKKSCAQMLLNGAAYTYLGLKVSTKTYYCCIYRPQPMYVPQSPDSKISMYSIWKIRKPAEDNPFNLSISESMGLYCSRSYTDIAYSVAKPSSPDLVYTYSEEKMKDAIKKISQKSDRKIDFSSCMKSSGSNSSRMSTASLQDLREKSEPIQGACHSDMEHGKDLDDSLCGDSRDDDSGSISRVKIFAGGFKSTEDYTYVRGRGRGRYVCETCGIRCKKPSMLKKHIRTHTNLRPYPCAHCTSR